jgi:hypothetical protein
LSAAFVSFSFKVPPGIGLGATRANSLSSI